jgi:hypothetical protein
MRPSGVTCKQNSTLKVTCSRHDISLNNCPLGVRQKSHTRSSKYDPWTYFTSSLRGRRGRDRMVVEFTIPYAVIVYHH